MRLKFNPKAKEVVEKSPIVIHDPSALKGRWKESVSENKPIFLEIGCGKGQFLSHASLEHPQNFYIGVEMFESVLMGAIKKAADLPCENLRFLSVYAENLLEYFDTGEVDRIFLNFSDPWPKKRHAKRRLTSPKFLDIYRKILAPEGIIEIKTDNDGLYEYSLETLLESPNFKIIDHTFDLYNNEALFFGNIPTEYETKFHNQGKPIHKIITRLNSL